jgi:hypothetical protein
VSNAIDLGFARPVATRATSYPAATDGLMDLDGVREIGQFDTATTLATKSVRKSNNRAIPAATDGLMDLDGVREIGQFDTATTRATKSVRKSNNRAIYEDVD